MKARRSHGVSAIDHDDTSRTSLQQYQMEGTKENAVVKMQKEIEDESERNQP